MEDIKVNNQSLPTFETVLKIRWAKMDGGKVAWVVDGPDGQSWGIAGAAPWVAVMQITKLLADPAFGLERIFAARANEGLDEV